MKHSFTVLTAALFAACLFAASLRAEEPAPAPPPQQLTKEQEELNRRMEEMSEAYKDYKATGNEASRLKAKEHADELMVQMNAAMRVMPVMIKLCGVTGAKADMIVALNKRTTDDALLTLDDEKKKKLADSIADVEKKLTADWETRPPELRDQECAAIRKQVGG